MAAASAKVTSQRGLPVCVDSSLGTTYVDDDVAALTAFPAHVGFTAATGAQHNDHLIDALTVQTSICDEG